MILNLKNCLLHTYVIQLKVCLSKNIQKYVIGNIYRLPLYNSNDLTYFVNEYIYTEYLMKSIKICLLVWRLQYSPPEVKFQ